MLNTFKTLTVTRNNILNSIEGLSIEELNKIPTGFSNNIMWNVAHIVVTQQLLCYGLSNTEMNISSELIEMNRKGSSPNTGSYSKEDIQFWKTKLIENVTKLENDFKSNLFKEYTEYPTSFNLTLTNIEDAIRFNNTHDALHFGYIMAMKKAINN